ncbi:C2 calcium-dependent membrane-targeting protein [Tanacetum coccineum]
MEGLRKNRKSKGKAKIHETDYYDDPINVDADEFANLGMDCLDTSDIIEKTGTIRKRASGHIRKLKKANEDGGGTSEVSESISVKKMKSCDLGVGSSNGFGNFVEFKVDGIPSKLGLYVVDKFDDKNMELKLAEGSLKITKNLISEMLGIRNEGIDIMAEEGKRNEEMMTYVDGSKCNSVTVVRKRPPTLVWTSELLSKREVEELNSGGFGFGEIEGLFVEQEDPMPDSIEGFVWNPEYYMGVQTQEEVLRSVDDVDAEIERRKWCDMFDIPSFSLGLTQEYADLDQHVVTPVATTQEQNLASENSNPLPLHLVPLRVCPPGTAVGRLRHDKDKRPVTISEVRKSPFIGRVVDADGLLNAEEKRVTKYLFEVLEDHSVTLFKTISGQHSTRVQMQSLAQREYVDNNVLDTWGSVLNHMEVYRSKKSPFRMFLPTFVVNNTVYNNLRGRDGRFQAFMGYVVNAIENDSKCELLKNIDVVFIPVDNGGHKFLFVADLKNSCAFLIDHEKNEKIFRKRVKKKIGACENLTIAAMLQEDFRQYLMVKNHTKAGNIIGSKIEVSEFDWQTNSMETEAGIFVMRHMESFMGMGMDKLNCCLAGTTRWSRSWKEANKSVINEI